MRRWIVAAVLLVLGAAGLRVPRGDDGRPVSVVEPAADPAGQDRLEAPAVTASSAKMERTARQIGTATIESEPGEVFGRVIDDLRESVSGVHLRFEQTPSTVFEAISDAEGEFSITVPRPVTGILRNPDAGHVPFRIAVRLSPDEPRARVDVVVNPTRRLSIVLRASDGSLLPDKTSSDAYLIAAMNLYFARARPAVGRELALCDRLCALRIYSSWPDAPFGAWTEMETPGTRGMFACLLLGSLVIDAQPIPEHATTLELSANIDAVRNLLGHVTAQVVDAETGVAIEGATLQVNRDSNLSSSTRTDSQGRARSRDVLPGRTEISIRDAAHLETRSIVIIASGLDTDMGVIRLERGFEIAGRVVFTNGTGAHVWLHCSRRTGAGSDWFEQDDQTRASEVDGSFRFDHLRPGEYQIDSDLDAEPWTEARAGASARPDQLIVDATRGSVRGLTLRLP